MKRPNIMKKKLIGVLAAICAVACTSGNKNESAWNMAESNITESTIKEAISEISTSDKALLEKGVPAYLCAHLAGRRRIVSIIKNEDKN